MQADISSVYEHLLAGAKAHPDRIAVATPSRSITYARFLQDVDRVARWIASFGLSHGATVGVQDIEPYCHWVTLLACERQALATFSFEGDDVGRFSALFARLDLVLHHPVTIVRGARDWRLLTTAVFADLIDRSEGPDVPGLLLAAEAVVRLVPTVSSTGWIKIVKQTAKMRHDDMVATATALPRGEATTLLCPLSFSIEAVKRRAEMCLASGGTVIFDGRSREIVAETWHITHAVTRAHEALGMVALGGPEPGTLIDVVDAPPLKQVCEALESAGCRVVYLFASEELGPAAFIGADGALQTLPDTRLHVDADNRIWVGTSRPISSYLNASTDDEALRGDSMLRTRFLGRVNGAGQTELLGAADDLLSLKGYVFAPQPLEQVLLKIDGVQAARLDVLRDVATGRELAAGLLVGDPAQAQTYAEALSLDPFPREMEDLKLAVVKDIAQDEQGRPQREAARRVLAEKFGAEI